MAGSRREDLVEKAVDLFYQNGFHATGIDRILAEAGVAKMTLYKHFKSKDALIVEGLRRHGEAFRSRLRLSVEERAKSPKKRLVCLFDALEDWFLQEGFQGCLFINASAEFGRADDPVHVAAAEHKALVRQYICELAVGAGASHPEELSEQIFLLMEGATVAAQVSGMTTAARQARRVAKLLVKAADL